MMNKHDPANNNAEKLIFKNKKPHKLFHWSVIMILALGSIMDLSFSYWFLIVGEYWRVLILAILLIGFIWRIVDECKELVDD